MGKKVGFLGCGKIGRTMMKHMLESNNGHSVAFAQDIVFPEGEQVDYPQIKEADPELYAQADLIIETATASVLKANFDMILEHTDLLMFSVTAFADEEFEAHAREVIKKTGHKVFLPHGAILGIDGLFDARDIITSVSITTTKNPPSLGRKDDVKTVVYEGPAREACKLYPRNVNVHATTALAGIGFDKTKSMIISDPDVDTNTHHIVIDGEGIHFEFVISSFTTGRTTGTVSGAYTPISACGSLDRVLQNPTDAFMFV